MFTAAMFKSMVISATINIVTCIGWGIGVALSIRVALWILDVKI